MTTQLVGLNIRPFEDADYDAYARLFNGIYVDFLRSADEFRFEDNRRESKCKHGRWVAERDNRVVGVGEFDQYAFNYHPCKFMVEVLVDQRYFRQGIGAALYTTVMDALAPHGPIQVDTWSREDMPCRLGFLDDRGFVENWRAWASELILADFDPTPFQRYVDDVLAQGIELVPLSELLDDPAIKEKMYDMNMDIRRDLPLPPGEERQDQSFEEWLKGWDAPHRLPEGYYLAVCDGQLVGTSQLWTSIEPDMLRTGLTGVRRDYRRRGIAFALKLKALEFARKYGAKRVVTDNASINRPMLSINEAIGFVKQPAWIHYVKAF